MRDRTSRTLRLRLHGGAGVSRSTGKLVEDADGLAERERRQRQAREPLRERRHSAEAGAEVEVGVEVEAGAEVGEETEEVGEVGDAAKLSGM